MRIKVNKLPGKKSAIILNKLKKLNLAHYGAYPFIQSKSSQGCYIKDIDNNVFLDFSSQVASTPLGYNHPMLLSKIKKYAKVHPVKLAGQDFPVKEHRLLLEELLSITPKSLDTAFLINSGAEAVENCIKVALRHQHKAKFGISFINAFHGRTLGALSCTDSKALYKKYFFSIPIQRLPFNESALDILDNIIKKEASPEEIGFIIVEPIQGEGGYNFAPQSLLKGLRKFTSQYNIPFIIDEVQSGMGRTGKWWAFQHYNIQPDIFSAAKALQVGATITSNHLRPEPGALSSTWGAGHILDMAIGLKTIQIIKKQKLLSNINQQGNYLLKQLQQLPIENPRGLGLMIAFDLETEKQRNNMVLECLRHGLVVLGCGESSIRLIPPYIIKKQEINQALEILESAIRTTSKENFQLSGLICNYMHCPSRTR